MDPTAPLLFFNSGVGGLSVLGPTRALLPNAPIVYAADNAGFPYGKRSEAELASARPGAARAAGRAIPPAPGRHRLQHRLDHRARPCPRGARHAGGRHGPRDQAGRGDVEEPGDRRARHRSDRPPALCRRPRRASSPPIARSSATARPSWSSWPRPSWRGRERLRRGRARRGRSRCSTHPTATGSTRWCWPAPISRCSPTRLPTAFPGVA